MSLLDLVTPSKTVVLTQAFSDKPEVAIEVFGLTTEDFIFLAEKYPLILAEIFLRNSKADTEKGSDVGFILSQGADFIAAIIGCGCKERDAADWVKTKPTIIQAELLTEILALTFPEGLKKSLQKLAPTIALLLRK